MEAAEFRKFRGYFPSEIWKQPDIFFAGKDIRGYGVFGVYGDDHRLYIFAGCRKYEYSDAVRHWSRGPSENVEIYRMLKTIYQWYIVRWRHKNLRIHWWQIWRKRNVSNNPSIQYGI